MDRLELDVKLIRDDFHLEVTDNLDLSGITAVFGASGSGKTSLLRIIAGLEPKARGLIRFRGAEWQSNGRVLPPEARSVGYVFQEGRLFPHLDVRGNLLFPLKHGRRGGPIGLDETIAALGLERLLSRHPASLSGGETQRVAIARALLANPVLLLMDEPLSSLDQARKSDLLPLIRSLPSRFQLPVVYVTHDLDELVYLADLVVLLADGRNIARGSARSVVERSDFAKLSALEDPGMILEAKIVAQQQTLTVAALGAGEIRLSHVGGEIGETIRLRVNPRDVILATRRPAGLSIRNCLEATVCEIDDHEDGQVSVRLSIGDQLLSARITRDAARELALCEGQRVFALIKTVALDAFGWA
jgi:molybdate transport system ATP-binding protein